MAVIERGFKISETRYIGGDSPCFVIAEIGQNHQGDFETAKRMILEAKKCGVDCVKFQKTCIPEKFNKSALERPYNSSNSWGDTYGKHKQHLEFSDEQFVQLQKYAADNDVFFSASAMDEVSVDKLVKMSIPFLKIGSGDSNNIPMIELAASKHIPLIISTGMIDKMDVEKIYRCVKKYHGNFCLMHCISSYPTPYSDCNLNVISDFRNSFNDVCIGYSGHEMGISVSIAAVALGAKVLERHFTLDKSQKGSDHCCSLSPDEMKLLIEQVRIIETSLGDPIKRVVESEQNCIRKLQKSLTAARALKAGHLLDRRDIKIKVTEPKGIDATHLDSAIGRTLKGDKSQDEPIFETDFIV